MKKSLATLLFLLSSMASADCLQHICSNIEIQRIYLNSSGLVYIGTNGTETKLDCAPVSNVYLTFNLSAPAGDALYATLLASQMSKAQVSIRIENGSQGCKIQYITKDSI